MIGKHIYVRCRDEQNNAGTWTAAVTKNIVDKDILRNYIEPRCNIDETFARNSLMLCPSNSVLRIYGVGDDTLVITRTYWVTDRITETLGRKGAYSVSYILSGEDKSKFGVDFGGAFDKACFESYDKLVSRTNDDPNKRITIDEKEDIFSHSDKKVDATVLEKCGFEEKSFVAFMNGLYDAVLNKKHLAIILPERIRTAWKERGDDTVEELSQYIFMILPEVMRTHIGMVSHWNCQIHDKMVGDMPVVFVHPQNEYDSDIRYLKRDGTHIIDLDKGQYISDIPNIAQNYFSFVWENRASIATLNEFWVYCETHFKKLYFGRPTSASAMECMYLLRNIVDGKYSDLKKCKIALLLAAREFAGAGTRIPMAENFICSAIDLLGEKELSDTETEAAIRFLMIEEKEETKHKGQEYRILLNAIDRGKASIETIDALCGEIEKEERNAVMHFHTYFSDEKVTKKKQIAQQKILFASKLLIAILDKKEKSIADYNLLRLLVGKMTVWEKALQDVQNWPEFISPIIDAFIAYTKSAENSAECIDMVYKTLFLNCYSADDKIREKCQKAVQKEEVRIYRDATLLLDNGDMRIFKYAEAFLATFVKMAFEANKETLLLSFERLFRMIFNPAQQVFEKALKVYKEVIEIMLGGGEGDLDRLLPLILKSEENALSDKPPIWLEGHTENSIVLIEDINLATDSNYYPSESRLTALVSNLNAPTAEIYPLFEKYLDRMTVDSRLSLYKALKNNNMLHRLYVHMILYSENRDIKNEIDRAIEISHIEKVENVLKYHRLTDDFENNEATINRFLVWYTNELKNALINEAVKTTENITNNFKTIYEELKTIRTFSLDSSELIACANKALFEFAHKYFDSIPLEVIVELPEKVVSGILTVAKELPVADSLSTQNVFEIVKEVDNSASSAENGAVCAYCEKSLKDNKTRAVAEKRLRYIIKNTKNRKLMFLIYYNMLKRRADEDYPLESLLNDVGYNSLTILAKGMLLVDIMIQLGKDNAQIENEVGRKVMRCLERIAHEDAESLLKPEFINKWNEIQNKAYAKIGNLKSVINKASTNSVIGFDFLMFGLCVIGLIITCVLAGALSFSIVALVNYNLIVSIIALAVVIMLIGIVDVLMVVNLLNSDNRRKNR